MEDDLNIFENGRRPQFFENGRKPQFSENGRGTQLFLMEDDLRAVHTSGDCMHFTPTKR